MKVTELKLGTVFKVIGGYWLYTGFNPSGHTCDTCHKIREHTHEFLHYKALDKLKNDLLKNDLGRFDTSLHFGSECVKSFINDVSISDFISVSK